MRKHSVVGALVDAAGYSSFTKALGQAVEELGAVLVVLGMLRVEHPAALGDHTARERQNCTGARDRSTMGDQGHCREGLHSAGSLDSGGVALVSGR